MNSYNIGDAANEDRAGMQREWSGDLVAFGSVNIGVWFLWVTKFFLVQGDSYRTPGWLCL